MARRSKRPDPNVSPTMRIIATGELVMRVPFTHSTYHSNRREKAQKARELNRSGVLGVKARDIVIVK